jgi:hypothetical protein
MRQFWPPLHRMIEWPAGPPLDVEAMPGIQRFETVTPQGAVKA